MNNGKLIAMWTDRPPAHNSLLEIILFNCKTDCNTQRCSFKKNGLECSTARGVCKGERCMNSSVPDLKDQLDDNDAD